MNTQKILIVEDERPFIKLLNEQLTTKGYVVTVASDGKEGLEAAKKEKPDLILLDLLMPVMDGFEMLEKLRKTPSLKGTSVMILTNLEPDEQVKRKIGDDEYVSYCIKSNTRLEELFEKIDKFFKKS